MAEIRRQIDISDSTFFCFKIDSSREGYFITVSDNEKSIKIEKKKKKGEMRVLQITTPNRNFPFLSNKINFKIRYEIDKSPIYESYDEFYIAKNEIKFIFDAEKGESKSDNYLKNPQIIDQYKCYSEYGLEDELFKSSLEYLKKKLDIEFYFFLYKKYENIDDYKKELINVLNNIEKAQIKIKKNNLGKINPKNYHKNVKKLIVINAIIENDIVF